MRPSVFARCREIVLAIAAAVANRDRHDDADRADQDRSLERANYQNRVLLTPETWRDPEGRGTVLVSGRLRQFTSGACYE